MRLGLVAMLAVPAAHVQADYFQGFEDPSWVEGNLGDWQNYGGETISRVTSGSGIAGVASKTGVAHAQLTGVTSATTAPYTTFGGYSSVFGGGFTASMDFYLDTSWAIGSGFDWSVAATGTDGLHERDFIAHIGVVDDGSGNGSLLFNASNNTDFSFNTYKLNNENGGNNYEITSAGWYTIEHTFYDDGGVLAVDISLLNAAGGLLHSITRSNAADLIPSVVGGNRYGWLTYNNIEGLAVDNTQLSVSAVPLPAAAWFFGSAIAGLGFVARRKGKTALAA